MKKEKLISYFILIGMILSIPSLLYLINNSGNLTEYAGEYFYIIGDTSKILTVTGSLIYLWSTFLMFFIYFKLIKRSNEFDNIKTILLYALLVGIVFITILPNTSKDIFFYMGNGRLADKYNVNPYTTTVSEIQILDSTDAILKTVGSQNNYTFVYGPVFLMICSLISKISFSSVTLYLYEFKIFNLIAYLITIYLIYKLTKKKKLAVVYAFNPLILIEVLVNVHNDIFVILFALLGILFIRESEKDRKIFWKSELSFILGLVFLVFSICIKYVIIIILPFAILYRLRKENFLRKITIGIVYATILFGLFSILYIPYSENLLSSFAGVIAQSGKLKDSIYLIIAMITRNDNNIVSLCYSFGFFTLLYLIIVKLLKQCFRKNSFKEFMENSYIVLLGLIFLGLTNLTSWYLIWLFIPVFWTTGKKVKNTIWIGFLYELTYVIFYITHIDDVKYQVFILPFIGICMFLKYFLNDRPRLKGN